MKMQMEEKDWRMGKAISISIGTVTSVHIAIDFFCYEDRTEPKIIARETQIDRQVQKTL